MTSNTKDAKVPIICRFQRLTRDGQYVISKSSARCAALQLCSFAERKLTPVMAVWVTNWWFEYGLWGREEV
jgi:hypothetical protein